MTFLRGGAVLLCAGALALTSCSSGDSGSASGSSVTSSGSVTGAGPSAGGSSSGSSGGAPGTSASPSRSGSVTPSPTARPAASGSSSALAAPKLNPPKGYSYGTAPAAVAKAFQPIAKGQAGVLSAPTVRAVKRGSAGVGTVAAMTVEQSYLADKDLTNTLLSGLVKGLSGKGFKVSSRTVTAGGGRHIVMVGASGKAAVATWISGGAVHTLVGADSEKTALGFAAAVIAAG